MEKTFDVEKIVSGPAGLTAGVYTVRGAASTILFEGEKWGGQLMLTTLVENYPGFADGIQGPDLMAAMRKQAENLGVKPVNQNVTGFNFSNSPFELTASDGNKYLAKSVIVATGAETRWLDIPGEKELIGRGISSCAPCDAPFFKDKAVAVIGGGDSAMEEALVLSKFAKKVTIIHRRKEFRASEIMQQKVKTDPKISIIWNKQVIKALGTSKLEKIILEDIDTKAKEDFVLDGMFVAVGHIPACIQFEGILDLDEKGYLKRMPKDGFITSTSVKGIFTAGDVHDEHYKQAVTAAGFGCMAALDALKYLE